MEESAHLKSGQREGVLPSGKAIASLIISILALLTFFIPVLGIIGLVYGVGALREIRAGRGRIGGAKAASAGVALAVASFILAAIFYGSGPLAREVAQTYLIAEGLKSYSEKHNGRLPEKIQEIAPFLKERADITLDPEDFLYLGDPSIQYGEEKIVVCSARAVAGEFFIAVQADGKVKILKKEEVETILSEENRASPEKED